MNVVFRADASIDIGTGHVMRCLTLANALRDVGANCHFICREHAGNLIYRIKENGFDVTALPVSTRQASSPVFTHDVYASWLGVDWETDARQTTAALSGRVDWMVTDHYAIDHRWESRLRSRCHKLMVIDDLADRDHDCDLLLDQNAGRKSNDYLGLVPAGCTVLTGPAHALLRPEFPEQRAESLARHRNGLHELLVSMGGIDKDNASAQVLASLKICALPANVKISVVLGPHAPWIADVQKIAASMAWPTRVLVDVEDMASLMAQSDLAIGAAGGSALERCCLGLPSIVIPIAENQLAGAKALTAQGGAILASLSPLGTPHLSDTIAGILSEENLHAASVICASVTDGLGAMKLASLMNSAGQTRLRTMQEADLAMVLAWRNAPKIRCCMLSTEEITPEAHAAWFGRSSTNPDRKLLIVESAGVPIGFVQFSGLHAEPFPEWGFYAAPEAPKGSGTVLGKLALEYAFRALHLPVLIGRTLPDNEISIRFHHKLGFRLRDTPDVQDANDMTVAHTSMVAFELRRDEWEHAQGTSA